MAERRASNRYTRHIEVVVGVVTVKGKNGDDL